MVTLAFVALATLTAFARAAVYDGYSTMAPSDPCTIGKLDFAASRSTGLRFRSLAGLLKARSKLRRTKHLVPEHRQSATLWSGISCRGCMWIQYNEMSGAVHCGVLLQYDNSGSKHDRAQLQRGSLGSARRVNSSNPGGSGGDLRS